MINPDIENLIYTIGLEQLKKKGDKFHFRCYVCKDSQKNERKKRAWIINKNGDYFYHCFNCGYSRPLSVFLKDHCYHIYVEYVKTIIFKLKTVVQKKSTIDFKRVELEKITDLTPISELDVEHRARKYLSDRQVPFKFFDDIYFCYNYPMWVNSKIANKFAQIGASDERIVWPIFNINKKIVGAQGRAISKYNKLRYISILFNENELNVCGLEKVKRTEKIYVTEGYIDSLFLPNAISINSADIDLNRLLEVSDKNNFIFVYDNERRNNQITNRIVKVIKAGFNVVIWPDVVSAWGKDINQMILNGHAINDITSVINTNVFKGVVAEVKLKLR